MANPSMFNNINWFDDIFDIVNIDDDNDDDKHEVERMILDDYYEDFDFPANDEEEEEEYEESVLLHEKTDIKNENIQEEEVLSQKLIQLSTEGQKRPFTTPTSSQEDNRTKRICLSTIVDVKQPSNQIISYLETMDEMFNHSMRNSRVPLEDLRLIMECKHQIGVIQLDLQRWTRYYEVGVQEQIWSMEVKQLFTMKNINEKQYEIYIQQYIDELHQKLEQLQQQFDSYKKDLVQFTDLIERKIDEFIQHYRLLPYKMKSNYQLARFEYEYQDLLLERQFLQLQPTDQQIESAKNRCKSHFIYKRAQKELIELKHRIQCNQPIQDTVTQALSKFSTTSPIKDLNFYQQEIDYDEKQLQQHLNHLMMKAILATEQKVSQCEHLFREQERISNSILTPSLMTLIHRRHQVIEEKLNCTQEFRLNYYLRQHFGQQSDEFNLAKISFSPTLIVHSSTHVLYKEHLRLLSRGPSYVPPYQMMTQNLEKNYKQLQHDLNRLFVKSNVNMVQSIFLQKQIKDAYMEMFSMSNVSKSIYERAHYEQQLIETIRNDLKSFNLILRRTADQQNVFYLGDRNSFEQLSRKFMLQTDLFEIDMTIDNENLQATRDHLAHKIQFMNREFEIIFVNTTKYKDQLKKINVSVDKVELPYLYFLPDLSKQSLLNVKPMIMTTENSATYRLGKFLNQLLRRAIDIHQQGRIVHHGTDFLGKFQNYIDQHNRLRSTTNFVTITIQNYYHLAPHGVLLSTVLDFFVKCYHLPMVENIHITKIIRLISLFLHNNRFYYDGKIYRFIKGGPTNSGLIEILSNIYLNGMEKFLIDQSSMKNEFYGRCENQIFFTWNQSLDELQQILKSMTLEYHHLNFDIHIGKKLNYLDLYLENHDGILFSRVHHQPNQQPYTLPYISKGNSIRKHSHWLRSSLLRAIRYCTSVEDFNQERIYLEMTYLANGYSIDFIDKRIEHFFTFFDAKSLQQLPLDQHGYGKIRHRLFNFMREARQYKEKKQESFKKNQRFHLSYIYDSVGPRGKFNKKLREILSKHVQLQNPTFENSKLQLDITTKTRYSLNSLLSGQRPSHPILNKMN